MRSVHRWLHRPFAALLAVWFVLVLVEPAALHSCPVHGDHAAPSAAVGDAGNGNAAASDASHAGHHAGDQLPGDQLPGDQLPGDQLPGDQLPGDDHAGCTCPDDCAVAGTGMVVPGAQFVTTATIIPVAPAITDAPAARPLQSRIAFQLPFANGPPLPPGPA